MSTSATYLPLNPSQAKESATPKAQVQHINQARADRAQARAAAQQATSHAAQLALAQRTIDARQLQRTTRTRQARHVYKSLKHDLKKLCLKSFKTLNALEHYVCLSQILLSSATSFPHTGTIHQELNKLLKENSPYTVIFTYELLKEKLNEIKHSTRDKVIEKAQRHGDHDEDGKYYAYQAASKYLSKTALPEILTILQVFQNKALFAKLLHCRLKQNLHCHEK